MLAQRWKWIVWPAFLAACLLELVVFALVDPKDLQWLGQKLPLPREGVYTVAFFVFWAIAMASSAMTALLALTPREVNQEQPKA